MSELLFVTAQPDVPYFHWQCEIYCHNFVERGINPNQIHIIFGMVNGNTEPSEDGLNLIKKGYKFMKLFLIKKGGISTSLNISTLMSYINDCIQQPFQL